MSKRLANCRGRDLYAFWRERITQSLARCAARPARCRLLRRRLHTPTVPLACRELEGQPEESRFVVDCASLEYSRAIDRGALGAPVFTLAFPGPAVYAKQARGGVVRFAAETRARSPADFRRFTGGRAPAPPACACTGLHAPGRRPARRGLRQGAAASGRLRRRAPPSTHSFFCAQRARRARLARPARPPPQTLALPTRMAASLDQAGSPPSAGGGAEGCLDGL